MRILIVDDDAAIIESIRESINWKKLGISQIETAYNADRAKRILVEKEIDIVISDIEMPMESGLDLLRWYREHEMKGKFLLLTCHENFHYATAAVNLHAEEYLMKPFNVGMMEMVLQKLIVNIRREKDAEKSREYGEWVRNNLREVRLTFWNNLFSGRISQTEKDIARELEERKSDLDREGDYHLVITRVTNLEQDMDTYGRSLVLFILENFHSEMLCGTPENDCVTCYDSGDSCIYVTVCADREEEELRRQSTDLIQKCGSLLSCTLTCCISPCCQIRDFYKIYHRIREKLESNMVYYGEAFLESQVPDYREEHRPVLDMRIMNDFLENKDKKGFLSYLKKELDVRTRLKILDGEILQTIRQEIQQAVYVYLAKRGIQISLLLGDEVSRQIERKSEQSVLDLMRWANYLLGRAFDYEEEIRRSASIIDKINLYIHEHYKENIGRNEIGAAFFLVPEYLAKMYKKKTGQNLKDYINEYRLEQARSLLINKEMKVSDVAAEVGFDNFSYFSTLFKKSTGLTPNEYRKKS